MSFSVRAKSVTTRTADHTASVVHARASIDGGVARVSTFRRNPDSTEALMPTVLLRLYLKALSQDQTPGRRRRRNPGSRTQWWAGGYGVLDDCDPALVDFLVERGAVIDAHAAARLGKLPEPTDLVAADPEAVHARGGDGQTPLHFASTVDIAAFLLAHGAEIDALDVHHESTPAQYMLRVEQKRHYPRDRQDVARYRCSFELALCTCSLRPFTHFWTATEDSGGS